MIGRGGNSKTALMEAACTILGDNAVIVPAGSFTTARRQNASSATPEINRAILGRLALISELASTDSLNIATIKSWSGGRDLYYFRYLYDEGQEAIPQSKLVIASNVMPMFSGSIDNAAVDRLTAIPHTSRWSHGAPTTETEQYRQRHFVMDTRFHESINTLAVGILYMMKNSFTSYAEQGLTNKPPAVQLMTRKYWIDTDIFYQFITDTIEYAYTADGGPDMTQVLTLQQLYNIFTGYYTSRKPSGRVPAMYAFKEELEKRIGPSYSSRWYAIKVKSVDQTQSQLNELAKPASLPTKVNDVVLDNTSQLLYA
jgi:phage/plasmid-associated DNA primase